MLRAHLPAASATHVGAAQIDEFLLYGVVRTDEEARRALCMPNKTVPAAAAATFKIFGVELW